MVVVAGKHAVLLDFGIAKDLSAPASTTTQEGNVRGTPAYMAPERFFGQAAGITTDVYELALVLYAMLSARLPWDDSTDPEARLLPRPFGDLGIAVPAALDGEVRRALSTRAQNRPPSARALAEAVRAAASGSAAAQEPASTARMRPASEAERTAGEHAATAAVPGEQQTPLAWAPTAKAETARKSRRPWVLAAALAVVAAGGGAWWLRGDDAVAPSPSPSPGPNPALPRPAVAAPALKDDPWATPPPPKPETIPLVEPTLSIETYRAELAAAVARLPGDTRFLAAIELSELRDQPQVSELLDKLPRDPRIALLANMLPTCVRALLDHAEWVAFGARSANDANHGTIVVRGRWKRASVEQCLSDTAKPATTSDHATVYRLNDDGWLDFIDEHTVYVAARSDLDADTVHDLVRHGAGPKQHARDLFARQPADRAVAIVLDGGGGDDLSGTLGLPKGTDLAGWLRMEKSGVALDLGADPHDAAAAKRAADALHARIDSLFASAPPDAIGKLEVSVDPPSAPPVDGAARSGKAGPFDHTAVHVRGKLSALLLHIISGSI